MWLQRTGRALTLYSKDQRLQIQDTLILHANTMTLAPKGLLSNMKRSRTHLIYLLTSRDCIPTWEDSHGIFSELLECTTAHLAPFLSQQLPEIALSFYWILVNINLSARSARHSYQYMSRYFYWAFQGPKTPAIQEESGNDGSFNNYKTFYCFAF